MSDSEDETTTEHQLKFVLVGDGTAGKVNGSFSWGYMVVCFCHGWIHIIVGC